MLRPIDLIIGIDSSAATAGHEVDIAIQVNLLISKLRLDEPLWVTLFDFHREPSGYVRETLHNRIPIDQIPSPAIDSPTIHHDSGVALWDAIGHAFDQTNHQLREAAPNDSHRACFLFITHGGENDSRIYTRKEIRSKIDYAWNRWRWGTHIVGLSDMAIDDAKFIGAQVCNLHGMEAAVRFTRRSPHPNP